MRSAESSTSQEKLSDFELVQSMKVLGPRNVEESLHPHQFLCNIKIPRIGGIFAIITT